MKECNLCKKQVYPESEATNYHLDCVTSLEAELHKTKKRLSDASLENSYLKEEIRSLREQLQYAKGIYR